jgi:hypothetical protein
MEDVRIADAHDKANALQFALIALIMSLRQSGTLVMDTLFMNLSHARERLERDGKVDAAQRLAELAEDLQGVD